jgi:SPP1 family phage portal protein
MRSFVEWLIKKMTEWFVRPLDSDVLTIQNLVTNWKSSEMLRNQILGQEYYQGYHEILSDKYDIERYNRTNEMKKRIVDNQYRRIVSQKNNYLFGKPFSIQHPNKPYNKKINDIFTKNFKNIMRRMTLDMHNCGIAFMYVYYDKDGEFRAMRFKPYECIPVWQDDDKDVLSMLIRVVDASYIKRGNTVYCEVYEVYEADGVTVYDEAFRVLSAKESYLHINGEGYNWEKLPIVQFKLNDDIEPLINRVKYLQDALNLVESNYFNNVTMNIRDVLFVLKGYPDEDLSTFYEKITTLGVVNVDGEGDVTTLDIKIEPESYKTIVKMLKESMVENAMTYYRDLERLGTNVNQMNILSQYSDIDLDSNGIESEVRDSFDRLLWFVNTHLGEPISHIEGVTITFNRDMLMNESETIANIVNSADILAPETLVEHHPWVSDVDIELARIETAKKSALEKAEGALLQSEETNGTLDASKSPDLNGDTLSVPQEKNAGIADPNSKA